MCNIRIRISYKSIQTVLTTLKLLIAIILTITLDFNIAH